MRFRFRLDPLLHKAEYQEDTAMRRLGEAVRQVVAQEIKIDATTSQRGDVIRQLEMPPNSRIHLAQLASGSRAVLRLRGEIMKQREVLIGFRQEAERRRVELVSATQEKKKLEKLKERQKIRFEAGLKHRDTIEQDEIAGRTDLYRRREANNSR